MPLFGSPVARKQFQEEATEKSEIIEAMTRHANAREDEEKKKKESLRMDFRDLHCSSYPARDDISNCVICTSSYFNNITANPEIESDEQSKSNKLLQELSKADFLQEIKTSDMIMHTSKVNESGQVADNSEPYGEADDDLLNIIENNRTLTTIGTKCFFSCGLYE